MKQLIKNYSFNVSSKTVTLNDFTVVRLDRLQLIVDVTLNQIIYNFADNTVTTASVTNNVITLGAVPGGAANGDALQIIYEVEAGDPLYSVDAVSGAVQVTNFPATQQVSFVPGQTNAVSGTVTSVSGTFHSLIDNFPTVFTVQFNPSQTLTAVSASGTLPAHIDNFPTIQTIQFNGPQPVTVAGTQAVSGTINGVIAASGVNNVHVDDWPTNQSVTVTNPVQTINEPGNTLAVSGSVTSASGTQNVHVDNFPTVQTVQFNPTQSVQVGNLPAVTTSGVQHALVDNFPTVQTVQFNPSQSVAISGVVSVSGTFTNEPGVPVAVSGIVAVAAASGTNHTLIDNFPTVVTVQFNPTQSVNVGNFPASFQVTNIPGQTLPVSGTLSIASVSGSNFSHVDNFPTVQTVQFNPSQSVGINGVVSISGTVTNEPGVPIAVSGTINSVVSASGVQNVHVDNYPTVQTVQFNPSQTLAVSSVAAASGVQNVHVDNYPTVQMVDSTSGSFHAAIDNFPTIQTVSVPGIVSVSGTFTNEPGVPVAVSGTINSVVSASGVQNVHVDNFPTVQTVQFNPTQTLNVSSVLAASGVQNVHVDNYPTVQMVDSTSGSLHAAVDNFPTVQTVAIPQVVSVSGTFTNEPGVPIAVSGTINAVVSASGVQNVHIDNYPTVQTVQFNPTQSLNVGNLPAVTTSGVQHSLIDNFPTVQTVQFNPSQSVSALQGTVPWTTSGSAAQPTYQVTPNVSAKVIVGTDSTAGMTLVASGISGLYIKVFAFELTTQASTQNTIDFRDSAATLLWQTNLQAPASVTVGAALAVEMPGFIFRTGQGNGLDLNLSAAQSVNYSIGYFYDSNP